MASIQTSPAPLASFHTQASDDSFEIIHESECKIEDDYRLVTGNEVLSQGSLSRKSIARWLVRRLGDHTTNTGTCAPMCTCILCLDLIEALDFLFHCTDEWEHHPPHSLNESLACILQRLRALSSYHQRVFNYLLTQLLGNSWAEQDHELAITGDFEISAVIWILYIGPRRIANGLAGGLSMIGILMDVEQEWVLDHVEGSNFKAEVKVLKCFARALCVWGKNISEPRRVGKEGGAKLAGVGTRGRI